MSSIIRANIWQNSAGVAYNNVIQFASATFEGIASSTLGHPPNLQTQGILLFSISFTPRFSNSKILVQTSTIEIHEQSNVLDVPWIALWRDTNFICANSGSALFSSFAGNLNMAHHSFNHVVDSWGTSGATLQIRAGMGVSTGQLFYVNGNTTYNYPGNQSRISCTVMEIAQ
jgi:hypothetical protein